MVTAAPALSVVDRLLAKTPERRAVAFCLDRDAEQRYAEAVASLDAATSAEDLEQVNGAVEAALEAVRAATVTVTFESIPNYEDLKRAHPPTSQDRLAARTAGDGLPEWSASFAPALVAESCCKVEGSDGAADGLTVDQVVELWKVLNQAERADAFNAALSAQLTRTVVL